MTYQGDGGPANTANPLEQRGMSLRDYFAAHVVSAVFASALNHNAKTKSNWPVTIPEIVEKAYRIADAMLAERECGP